MIALQSDGLKHSCHGESEHAGVWLPRLRVTTTEATRKPARHMTAAALPNSQASEAAPARMPPADTASMVEPASSLDMEAKAERVRELEQAAEVAHRLAQELNKAGRFEEAQDAYERMHQLEDAASKLAKEVGCVACVLGDPSCSASATDPAEAEQYYMLHQLPAWPSQPHSGADAAQVQLRQRAAGAVLGCLVGDAAAMGVHWIYDLALLEQLAAERAAQQPVLAGQLPQRQQQQLQQHCRCDVKEHHEQQQHGSSDVQEHKQQQFHDSTHFSGEVPQVMEALQQVSLSLTDCHKKRSRTGPAAAQYDQSHVGLEFMDPPRSPFYAYASGRNSPYGEQTLTLLRSLAASQGLDCVQYAHEFARMFGEGFDGYRDVSTKGFLRNYERGAAPPMTGAPDEQANCVARLAPLVAGWAGSPQLMDVVRYATRVTQNTDAAVAWAGAGAAILERVVFGASPSAATHQTIKELEEASMQGDTSKQNRLQAGELGAHIARQLRGALQLAATDVPTAVAQLGRNCHMPNALTSPLHVVLHMEYLVRSQADMAVVEAQPGSSYDRGAVHACKHADGGDQGSNAAAAAPAGPDQEGEGSSWPACMGPDAPWGTELARGLGARYVQGVRAAIREGGCCASRASYAGAVLGAVAGRVGIPSSWQQWYMAIDDVLTAATSICDARDAAARV